jgi:tRNA pseudouridine55 synthase
MDQVILIDKPAGWTSFDVVAKIRSNLRRNSPQSSVNGKQKLKVGHSGTLDPFATGLLIILMGSATKRQDEFMKQDKVYEATFRLGAVSTTGDPEGEITERGMLNDERREATPTTNYHLPSTEEVQKALAKFVGEITQVPPQYSAIKVNGKKAYELARAGKKVELKPRQVTIYSLELLEYVWPEIKVRAHVSSGTYIRTLAEDIGNEVKDAKTIEDI